MDPVAAAVPVAAVGRGMPVVIAVVVVPLVGKDNDEQLLLW